MQNIEEHTCDLYLFGVAGHCSFNNKNRKYENMPIYCYVVDNGQAQVYLYILRCCETTQGVILCMKVQLQHVSADLLASQVANGYMWL